MTVIDYPLLLTDLLIIQLSLLLGALPFLVAGVITLLLGPSRSRMSANATAAGEPRANVDYSSASANTLSDGYETFNSSPEPTSTTPPALRIPPTHHLVYHEESEEVDPHEDARTSYNPLEESGPWEQKTEHQKRLLADKAKALVRNALRSLFDTHAYVFESIYIENIGTIDQLVVCPTGIFTLFVYPHDNCVWRSTNEFIHNSFDDDDYDAWIMNNLTREAAGLEPHTEYPDIRGYRVDPDPDDLPPSAGLGLAAQVDWDDDWTNPLVLFPNARLLSEGANDVLLNLIDLTARLTALEDPPPDEHYRSRLMDDEDIDETAEEIALGFDLDPWIAPEGHHIPDRRTRTEDDH